MSGLTSEERSAVEQAADVYLAAMKAADWARVAQSFSADGVRIPPNEDAHRGREAIERWLGGIEELTSYELTRDRIDGADGIAYVRGRYDITLRRKARQPRFRIRATSWRSGGKSLTAPGASSRRCGTRASLDQPD